MLFFAYSFSHLIIIFSIIIILARIMFKILIVSFIGGSKVPFNTNESEIAEEILENIQLWKLYEVM